MPSSDTETLFTWFNEINIISQLSSNLFARVLPGDLTTSQFSVLNWFIRVDKEATPARLAAAFQVTRGAMTNTLKKLEQKALVDIRPSETSGRSKLVTLTPKGEMVRREAIIAAQPLFEIFASAIDPDIVRSQLPAIQEIRKYLDEYRLANNQ